MEDFKYFTEFLVEWIKVKKYKTSGDYDKIWNDLEQIFEDAMKNVYSGLTLIAQLCSEEVDDEEKKHFSSEDKELCKTMVKVLLYINGIRIAGYHNIQGIESKEGHAQIDSYFRCIVGRIILIKWLGGHCSRKKVSGTVLEATKAFEAFSKVQDVHKICEGLDFMNMSIGGKFLWKQIEQWAEQKKQDGKSTYVKAGIVNLETRKTQGAKCSTPKKGQVSMSPNTVENEENLRKVFGVSKEELDQLVKDGDKWDNKDLEDTLKMIEEEKKGGSADWEKNVYQVVQKNLKELFEKNMREKEKRDQQALVGVARSDLTTGEGTPPPQLQASSPVTTPAKQEDTPQAPSDPCSSGSSQEIEQKREQMRTQLNSAWEEQKQKVWTSNGQLDQGDIKKKMEGDVNRMLKELKGYMNMGDGKPTSIPQICGSLEHKTDNNITNQMKKICKRLVRVIYWMEGRSQDGKSWKGKNGKGQPWESYLKCIIGNRVILRILGNKCGAQEIMKVISNSMEGTANKFPPKSWGMDCNWVKEEDIKDKEDLIGGTLDTWLQQERKPTDGITELEQVMQWMECKDKEKEKEEQGQNGDCKNGRIVDLLKLGRSKELRKLVNIDPPAAKTVPSGDPAKSAPTPEKPAHVPAPEGRREHSAGDDGLPPVPHPPTSSDASPAKSAPAPKKAGKSATAKCEDGVVEGGMDAALACLPSIDGSGDLPAKPSDIDPDEAQKGEGLKGAVGSKAAVVNVAEGTTQLSSEPTTPTDPGAATDPSHQTPSTGTDTQTPSGSATEVEEVAALITQVLLVPVLQERGIQVLLVPVLQERGIQVLLVPVPLAFHNKVVRNHRGHLLQANLKDHHNKVVTNPKIQQQQQQHQD
ncbi:SICA antigen [Plasmodium coatneyi]|uniref:SICA antigen n=1 Tax=Plasmodium coatneyi TaxID=208452 RepID=A0A1B1DTA0_9APIC|nr:SICA antigen [Plasmodium coatneyi]ANQ05827.1 SICA antigen [Plasmodium coatneyi]